MSISIQDSAIFSLGERCCGCGVCSAACSNACIDLISDVLGFVRPHFDSSLCVGCGACERVCPVLNQCEDDSEEVVWWARAEQETLLERSSSGGIFGLLAKDVLASGGVVYGAAFSDDFEAVRHVRVSNIEDLDSIMRSKYVQSLVAKEIYKGVLRDLKAGYRVLFTGTACQTAALCNYLKLKRSSTDRLLVVDVICHGVPSPELWRRWLDYLKKREDSSLCGVNFRSKSTGWLTFSVAYSYATEKVNSSVFSDDWYMQAFLSNASLRGSCFKCPAKRKSGSDITIGDFWGIQTACPEAYDERGVSAVIANSELGQATIDSLSSKLCKGESVLDDVIAGNPALVNSAKPYIKRKEFLELLMSDMPIEQLINGWRFKRSLRQKVFNKLNGFRNRVLHFNSEN